MEVLRSRWSSNEENHRFVVEESTTGRPLSVIQGGGHQEVDAAVRAAHAAFGEWRKLSGAERAKYLRKAAAVLAEEANDLARLLARENGKPARDALQGDLASLVWSFEFFAGQAERLSGSFSDGGDMYTATVREPYGVVAGILPFNWPPVHLGAKAAPALAAGNTIVFKPGEQAPLTAMRIVDILTDILPNDVIHIVPGRGPEVGIALTTHPLVRKISFTGSPGAGTAVLQAAAARHTPVLLELGGKNPVLVFEDADLDRVVADCVEASYFNKGEACTAASRLLVHASLAEAFIEKFSAAVKKLNVGCPLDPNTDVGPLVSRAQKDRVLAHIERAQADGATVAAQAKLPAAPENLDGFFVAPTILIGVAPHMAAFKEEIFGPVACVTTFASESEGVQLANGTDFGLVAAVYTRDQQRALRVAREIEAGIVYINNYRRRMAGTPFGGTKASGYGREHSAQTMDEYSYSKALRIPSGSTEIRPTWPPSR
ncbi:MAG: aldehyde dehydrogenase [Proteobacteria bacterium]|nr:aldehyde dehydrogenase [Pseudomonadota bacterium]